MFLQWVRRLLVCWVCAICTGPGLASAQMFEPAGPYTDPASRLVLPETLGGLPRVSAYDYESRRAGLGVSFKYQMKSPTIFADVYVFNGGRALIPEGIDDPAVTGMIDSAIGEIRAMGEMGRYEGVEMIGSDSIPLGDAPGARRALRARFAYTLAEGKVYSHVYGLAVHNHFVKLRFTYRQDQSAEALPVLGAVLQDLGRIVGENLQ
jgi:hypothetical protein